MQFRYALAYPAIGIALTIIGVASVAGCSGGGSAGSAANPLVPQVPQPLQSQQSQTPFPGSDAAIALGGRVTAILSSTKFSYETGSPHGHVPVVYSESMVTPSNTPIRIGQSVSVKGSFNSRGELVATKVTVQSPTPSPTPTPHSSSTPQPTGRFHIATWAYDDANGPGGSVSTASVNKYLSYAQGNGKAVTDCQGASQSCKSVYYLNPNHDYQDSSSACTYHPDSDIVKASSESWFIHNSGYTDSTHRVHGKSSGGCSIWQMNPNSSGLQAWWRSYLRNNADNYDVYFLDSDYMKIVDEDYFPNSGGGCDPWPTLCHTTQEITDDKAEVGAHATFVNALSHSNGGPMYFFYQQASFDYSIDVSAFSTTSRFVGVSCEGCISTYASITRPTLYATVLNEMAAVNRSSGAFLLISHGNAPVGSATQVLQRLVTTGIIWLGYSEGHTIVQPDLESNTNNLAVWPEDLIYPSSPIQSMAGDVGDLQVASGIWRREFKNCYQSGQLFGRCAAVVNSTGSTVAIKSSWLSQNYKHVVKLSGGDVLGGGSATVDVSPFSPNSTTVQAGGALLLAE